MHLSIHKLVIFYIHFLVLLSVVWTENYFKSMIQSSNFEFVDLITVYLLEMATNQMNTYDGTHCMWVCDDLPCTMLNKLKNIFNLSTGMEMRKNPERIFNQNTITLNDMNAHIWWYYARRYRMCVCRYDICVCYCYCCCHCNVSSQKISHRSSLKWLPKPTNGNEFHSNR